MPDRSLPGLRAGWEKVRDECVVLADRLETVRPLLIDTFLEWNSELREIGKLLIAARILECEGAHTHRRRVGTYDGKKNDWYRFLVHRLVYGCKKPDDLFRNKVHFITFNYDASLEFHLYRALSVIDILKGVDLKRFLSERLVHVYGSVRDGIPTAEVHDDDLFVGHDLATPLDRGKPITLQLAPRKKFLDRCFSASQNLRTVDQVEKELNAADLKRACAWTKEAEVMYLLGYGFDPDNSRRIGLGVIPNHAERRAIMFTNLDSVDTVNKRASTLWFDHNSVFLERSSFGNNPMRGFYIERSTKHVYGALAYDFDPLETRG
jgi:hypothetical protein